jgi:hypothetical protein
LGYELIDGFVFQDKQWEAVNEEWMSCLKDEKPENILLIPSGGVQDHWPASLKKFVHTLRSLSFPREQADLQAILADVDMVPLSTVLSQGMNLKKKHEVHFYLHTSLSRGASRVFQ